MIFWIINDSSKAVFSFAAVLIVACPCAVALSIPFTFGNGLRVLGNRNFFLKNTGVFESIQKIDKVVFDKTGTLTYSTGSKIVFHGTPLTKENQGFIKAVAANSTHPLSRQIYESIEAHALSIEKIDEISGSGIIGSVENHIVKLGSEEFILGSSYNKNTAVYVAIDEEILGYYSVDNVYRKGLQDLINSFAGKFKLALISGDGDSEKENLLGYFPADTELLFNQKPKDKLKYIESCQKKGERIMFLGDGLNDAGALQKSNVGIVITENINNFTPASDAIVSADQFTILHKMIEYVIYSRYLVFAAYLIAFCYNIIGLSYAASGNLSPVVAAILMPVSSVSVVLFGIFSSTWLAKMKGIL